MPDPNHRADRFLQALQRDYVLVGKTRVHSWHAWVIIGACVGFVIALVLVANRSGELEPSRAAITGQVAAYSFDEGSGTTIEDFSGNNNTGTLVNGPAWTTGKIGGALSFDGVDDYVALGNPLSMRPINQITISAWINPTDVSTSKTIVSKDTTGAVDYFFRVQGPGGVRCNFEGVGLDLICSYVSTNVWQHLACTYDGSIVSIYKNGVLLGSSPASPVTYSDSGANIKIGRRDEGGGGLYFPGPIDDLRIYNRALSQTEIQTDMNTSVGGTTPPSAAAPTVSLSASPTSITSGGSSTLTWSSTDATSCTASGGWTGTQVTSGTQSVSPTTNTTYTLACTGTGGTATQSATVTVTATPDTTPPTVPTGLSATAVSSSRINLSWTASTDPIVSGQVTSGVTGYLVERCSGSTCTTFTQVGTPAANSYSDTGLTAATTYRYRVRATDAAGNLSSYSTSVSVTTPPPSTATNYFNWGIETNQVNKRLKDGSIATYTVQYLGATIRDCTIAHIGSCSMKLNVIGNDNNNQALGADTIGHAWYPFNIVGGPALYYRWWMKIMPGFSWGTATQKTKSNRVGGDRLPGGYTGYIFRKAFVIGECDDQGPSVGGGCLKNTGLPGNDYNIPIFYDMDGKADGLWHEYIIMVKPNSTTSSMDAEFRLWVDGVAAGQDLGWEVP